MKFRILFKIIENDIKKIKSNFAHILSKCGILRFGSWKSLCRTHSFSGLADLLNETQI
jgi:hypothetical protein